MSIATTTGPQVRRKPEQEDLPRMEERSETMSNALCFAYWLSSVRSHPSSPFLMIQVNVHLYSPVSTPSFCRLCHRLRWKFRLVPYTDHLGNVKLPPPLPTL